MHVTGMILGCLLLGQASGATLEPPQMVADALLLPSGAALTGQPMTLVSVLSSTMDRRQQLGMTRAYWRLAQAVAEYHFCFDHAHNLEQLESHGNRPASLRLVRASAAAMVRQAELKATAAQCVLAGLMQLPAGAPLPLPADHPHVGAYRTNFQALFAARTPPEPLMLIDRILPIQRQAIDDQAAAVRAAEDVFLAARDQQQSDAVDIAACSRELLKQQRAFIHIVREYNANITEYGLAVAGPMTSPQALVAILIGPARQGAAPVVYGDVRPTSANEPIADSMQQPTLAAPRTGWRTGQPTPAPPRDGLRPMGKNEPTLAPPQEKRDDDPATLEDKPLVPVEKPMTPDPITVKKPVTGVEGEVAIASPLYAPLLDAAPATRAKQLAIALSWDRALPEGIGTPMNLTDCVVRDPGTDRRVTIETYWRLRQRTAEYQSLRQEVEWLEELMPLVLERRGEPSGAAAMLRLHAARLAAQASASEAHVALIEAQYALALRLGATDDAAWPLASTVPHSGSYLLNLETQPRAVVESWPVRRLAATIPALCESVRQYATAVVEADAARVAMAEKYRVGSATLDQAIEGIHAQTRETLAVLGVLTDYNRAIVEYVLTVMPPSTPARLLVPALVVNP